MDWVVNLAFLLVGYLLRLLAEKPTCRCKKKHKEFKMPTLNPMKIAQEHQEKKEEARINRETAIMLANIDAYDGTSNGQQEVK